MIKNAENAIRALTSLGIALLGLGVVIGILVSGNMTPQATFVGDVVGGIIRLVTILGEAGLVGLISLGVILYILRD